MQPTDKKTVLRLYEGPFSIFFKSETILTAENEVFLIKNTIFAVDSASFKPYRASAKTAETL